MRDWMNYAGAALLILLGIFLYTWDSDFPTAGTPTLALPLIIAGLVWGGLTLRRQLTAPQGPDRTGGGGREDR
jgi:hypothetical protein